MDPLSYHLSRKDRVDYIYVFFKLREKIKKHPQTNQQQPLSVQKLKLPLSLPSHGSTCINLAPTRVTSSWCVCSVGF